jgi:hypothetical protein
MRFVITCIVGCLAGGVVALASDVPRLECFPIERIEPPLRAKAEALLLETMDSTALYTVIGGLKPMTSSFLSSLNGGQTLGALLYAKSDLQPNSAVLGAIDELRRALPVVRCGDDIQSAVMTDVDLSAAVGRSATEPFVFHMPAVRTVIAEFPRYFARLAITAHTAPETLLFTMHRLSASKPEGLEARREWMRATAFEEIDQIRANGALYGYARPAVEAFAQSVERIVRGEAPPAPGPPDQRLIMRIPAFKGEAVWYRKASVEETPEDAALRARAGRILAEYRKRREKYIGDGKPGVVAMLREWFCVKDRCSAEHANVR